mmetsp:Transcript_50523/g.110240  ORF Transcript_50523/g.110240 Transcript_50523/m.110240 type:complete len:142 (-) Transcript_50523:1090-1515(-)
MYEMSRSPVSQCIRRLVKAWASPMFKATAVQAGEMRHNVRGVRKASESLPDSAPGQESEGVGQATEALPQSRNRCLTLLLHSPHRRRRGKATRERGSNAAICGVAGPEAAALGLEEWHYTAVVKNDNGIAYVLHLLGGPTH